MNLINLAAILVCSASLAKEIDFHPVKKPAVIQDLEEVRQLNVSTKICEIGQNRFRVASASDEARCIDNAGRIQLTDEPANKFQEMGAVIPVYQEKKTPDFDPLEPRNHNSLKEQKP